MKDRRPGLNDDIKRDESNDSAYYRSEGLPLPKLIKKNNNSSPDETQAESLLKSLREKLGFIPPGH